MSNISDEELSLILSGEGFSHENHKAAAGYALPIILERGRKRALERAVKEGLDHAAKQLGIKEGEVIPKELAAEFTAFMMEKISPYIEHLLRSGRREQEHGRLD